MVAWTERDLVVNGARLRAYRTGRRGAPSVLLAHGLTDNARYWTRTVEALERDYDVVLYDARGHGHSERTTGPFGQEARAGDLAAVVEAYALEAPVLIGHSMGAGTVAAAAAHRPELARAVVLEDPAWMDRPAPSAAQVQAYFAEWKAWLLALRAKSRQEALAMRRASEPDWSDGDLSLSLDARLACDPRVLDDYQPEGAPWREIVAAIQCPVLLLTGEPERGALVTPQVAAAAAGLWRSGRWVHLAGASHSIRFSRFEAYIGGLREFLGDSHALRNLSER